MLTMRHLLRLEENKNYMNRMINVNKILKIFTIVVTVLLTAGMSWGQTCATIGTGSSAGQFAPINGSSLNYSYTQQVYTASEILANGGMAGKIEKVKFYYSAILSTTVTIYLYLGQTASSSLESGWISDASLTQVYYGTLSFSSAGWYEIDISNANYIWNGSSNILVAVKTNFRPSNNCTFLYTTTGSYQTRSAYDASSQISLNGNNVPSSASGTQSTQRPNITFCFTEASGPSFPMTCSRTYTGATTRTNTVMCTSGTYRGDGGEVFYRFIPVSTGNHSFTIEISSGVPAVVVIATDYAASNVLASTAVFANSTEVVLSANLNEGTAYYIIIDSFVTSTSSSYSITVSCPGDPVSAIECDDFNAAAVGSIPSGWTYTTEVYNPNNFSNFSSTPASVFIIEAQHPDMMTGNISTYSNYQSCAAIGSNCLCIEYAPAYRSYCQNVYLYPPVMHLYPATYSYSVLYSSEGDMSFNYYISGETVAASVCDMYFGTTADYTQMTRMSNLVWQCTRSGWESNIYDHPIAACNSFMRVLGTFEVLTEGDYYVCLKTHANCPTSYDNTYPAWMTLDNICIEPLTTIITCTHLDPPTLNVINETDRSVSVSWNSISHASSYTLYYGVTNPNSSINNVWSVPNATSPVTIPELTNGQTYNFAVMPVGSDPYCPENDLSPTRVGTPVCNE